MKPLTAEEIAELRSQQKDADHWVLYEVGLRDVAEVRLRAVYELAKAAPRLLDEVERSRALLKRIEWGAHGSECPSCGVDAAPFGTHEPGCELAALIGTTT